MDNKFKQLINLGINGNKIIRLLISTIKTHELMETEYLNRIESYVSNNKFINSKKKSSYINYLEKNFFSILLLSIFKNHKIPKESIVEYGIILHSLRGMVTCTDNIIDNESKGAIFLNEISNHVLANNMLSIIEQNILNDSINRLTEDSSKKSLMLQGYTKALYSVAIGESIRELKDDIEVPEEIIENIHKKIGGELLELAFIIPTINENNPKLEISKNGIYQIGIALQMIDDICDFQEDIEAKKKNYLLSKIFHNSSLSLKEVMELAFDENFYNSTIYLNNYSEAIEEAIDTALYGFKILENSGYPINRDQGKIILEFMFKIRGLAKAWENYKNQRRVG